MFLIRSTILQGKQYKKSPSAPLMFKTWLNIYSNTRLKIRKLHPDLIASNDVYGSLWKLTIFTIIRNKYKI